MIKIKVPATTANVGPGFDAVGIALQLYNKLSVSKAKETQEFIWPNTHEVLKDSDNLILKACHFLLDKHPEQKIGFSIHMDECNIPISRGLGSSAAAIVAGLYAANYLLDDYYTIDELIDYATELEGHPDNVVPAILGGMVISTMEQKEVLYSTVNFPKELLFNVMIPNFELSTSQARNVLPSTYSRKDCVFNISRVSMLINVLSTQDFAKIRPCLKDAIHQPYRLDLIEDGQHIMKASEYNKSLGEFISGAGPTLIALTHKDDQDFKGIMDSYLSTLNNHWSLKQIPLNTIGTRIEVFYE